MRRNERDKSPVALPVCQWPSSSSLCARAHTHRRPRPAPCARSDAQTAPQGRPGPSHPFGPRERWVPKPPRRHRERGGIAVVRRPSPLRRHVLTPPPPSLLNPHRRPKHRRNPLIKHEERRRDGHPLLLLRRAHARQAQRRAGDGVGADAAASGGPSVARHAALHGQLLLVGAGRFRDAADPEYKG